MNPINQQQVSAVILAGGMGRRMGGQDKGRLEFNGKPLIKYVLETIRPQVKTILINANRHQAEYARYGYTVVADLLTGYQGPLAGFATGALAGLASGDDSGGFISFTAEQKALGFGILFAIPGGIIGAIVGGKKTSIPIYGKKDAYARQKEELRKFQLYD